MRDYATSASFKGNARAMPGVASIASRSHGSVLRVAGYPRLDQRHFEAQVEYFGLAPEFKLREAETRIVILVVYKISAHRRHKHESPKKAFAQYCFR